MEKHVIIIGGGSGGLALALFLEKAGIQCEIYEQAPKFSNVGASFALHPNGVHVLKELGLSKELKKASHSLSDYILKNKEGEDLFDMQSLTGDSSLFEGFIYLTRYNLIELLYQEVKRKSIPLYFSKKLVGFTQHDDSVTAQFKDGTEVNGSILIGADGTHSKVRSLLFPYEYLRYNGKWAVFGMGAEGKLGNAEIFLDQDYLSTYFKDNFNLTISKHHPTAKDRLSWVYIEDQERKIPKKDFEDKPIDEFKNELAEKFSDFKDPIQELIVNSHTFIPTQIYNIGKMSKFSLGRVALIGDALQTTDPYTGMGATLSLEDALYLAKMFREYKDYEDAFYYYEFDRKETVHNIHDSAKLMENIDSEITKKESMNDKKLSSLEDSQLKELIDNFLKPQKVYWNA